MTTTILEGDALAVLATLPAGSVQCCVTSPPYWGLRDYGVGGQIGLETTPEEYVGKLVAVFAEVRRVLAVDGTCWVNLGDSYASDTKGSGGPAESSGLMRDSRPEASRVRSVASQNQQVKMTPRRLDHGLKTKDLVGIPWRVAFALQADGWWLRSDIIWHKPNPMPESVTDRPTKAHEYIFLLSKSATYFYDADAIADRAAGGRRIFAGRGAKEDNLARRDNDRIDRSVADARNAPSVWTIVSEPFPEAHFACFPEELARRCIRAGSRIGDTVIDPFCGSGTTGAAADAHQRSFLGIELNPEYVAMARRRVYRDGAPLFTGTI